MSIGAIYDFNEVPSADLRSFNFSNAIYTSGSFGKSVLLRIKTAETWQAVVDELVSLCDEVAARQAAARGDALFNCPLAQRYVDDRLCLDDPLHGYMIREKTTGCLQGFIVYTTFTTWLPKGRVRWTNAEARLPLQPLLGYEVGASYCCRTFKKQFNGVEYQVQYHRLITIHINYKHCVPV
jgi:hypothetical protein